MARSLGLTAYRALTRRQEVEANLPDLPRPEGELVWIHAPEPGSLPAVTDLARRLCILRYGLKVLLTLGETPGHPPPAQIITQLQPGEHPEAVAAFLNHWQPDACLWLWGRLRPNLLTATAEAGCTMILLDADTGGFDGRRDRWLSDMTRELLAQFDHLFARSVPGKRRLVQLGCAATAVEVTSALMAGGQALSCADSDLSEMAQALGGRPVWFAPLVHREEIDIILTAHRQAMRLSHRLLLILMPTSEEDAQEAMARAQHLNLDARRWEDAGPPDDTTQVLVASDAADRALFFRVAPVSFMGASLVPESGGVDPFEASALGSAVLYGPKVRDFMPSYKRLAAAGAARIVNDATALGTAVSHLIAPDQAAAMAHAGWDVISEGADLTDRVVELVQDTLDQNMGRAP